MKENERKVLHIILERSEPITAVELAAAVGVSERTVRSYVHSINRQAGMTCIESSRKGYWYRVDAARNLLDRENLEAAHASIPQTNAERSAYLVNRVLRSPVPLATADLAEELFVSTSTMNAVLSRARRHLAPFDLTLVQADGHLSVHGTEKNKRRVLGELLYDEASASFLDVATIQHAFPDIDAARIREVVVETLDRHRFFVNGYSLINIVLHIAIAIDRIRNSKASHEESLDKPGTAIIQAHDLAMANEIAENLSEDFCVPFAPSERKELALLLSTRTTHIVGDAQSDEELEQIVGKDCLALVNRLIGGIESYYFINLSEREFYARFALHIKNLLARADQKSFSRNPLTGEIRATCPLLYDSGVYCASVIAAETGFTINDDEIAYIAFHLGSALEAQRQLAARVKCVLFCPAYYNIDKNLQRFLERNFPDDVLICDVATSPEELSRTSDVELILASAPLNDVPEVPVYRIGIAPKPSDVGHIRALISRIQLEKRRVRFREQLEALITPELFEARDAQASSREQAIDVLAETLERNGFVQPGYAGEIWERENLSATAFGCVAVPHALKPHAERSGIAVLVPSAPLDWAGSSVSLVLMLSFSLHERAILNEIFDPLISVLIEPTHVTALAACHDRETFIDTLAGMME